MMNYLFVIIFTFSCFLLNAQNLYFCFGFNTSKTSCEYNNQSITQREICPDINFLLESNNKRNVSIKSGVILCRSFDIKYSDPSQSPVLKVNYKVNYIEIPVIFNFNLHKTNEFLYFISAGLSYSHGIGGEKNTITSTSELEEGFPNQIKSNNLGLILTTGVNRRNLQLSIYYRYFNNLQKSSESNEIKNLDNTVVGINLSFIMRLLR